MNIFGPIWDDYLSYIVDDWKDKVSPEDLVLISGDLSWAMDLESALPDLEFFNGLAGKKIIIRGNHDYWWSSISKVRSVLPENMYAVQNDAVKIGRAVIAGSRLWTTPEPGKAQEEADKRIYDREVQRLKLSLESAVRLLKEGDRLYVMVHYPPFNSKMNAGVFTDVIKEYAPRAVVYGHLHGKESRGKPVHEIDGVKYYLTSCDLVGNNLVLIDEIT